MAAKGLLVECDLCGEEFVSDDVDNKEAVAEFEATFPSYDVEDTMVLCESCYVSVLSNSVEKMLEDARDLTEEALDISRVVEPMIKTLGEYL